MAFSRSTYDSISKDLSGALRKITDINMQILGTEIQVLRVTRTMTDSLGNTTQTMETHLIDNAILSHPLGGNIKFYATADGNYDINVDGIDIWDLLPFILRVPFENETEDDKSTGLKKGDLIVYILLDHNQTKIPIIFEVTRLVGGFMQKNMTKRAYELALYRETLETDIQTQVDAYIAAYVP